MTSKTFSIVVINLLLIALPCDRLSSCVDTPNPDDAYTGFFRNDLSDNRSFKPFYFYPDHLWNISVDTYDTVDAPCMDWVRHYQHQFTRFQAHRFICETKPEDLRTLYNAIQQKAKKQNPIPSYLRNNPMATTLRRQKDTAALRYIIFARETEIIDNEDDWNLKKIDEQRRDSLTTDSLQRTALAAYHSSTNAFIKMRYAYQAIKCAFYNHHNLECLQFEKTLMTDRKAAGSLYAQTLSYKAGIDYREGRPYLAAYEFSRAFNISDLKLKKYISLLHCTNTKDPKERERCLAFCKNNAERANFIGMCCLGTSTPEFPTLEKMFRLSSNSDLLEILTLREINKIEEHYFSPRLHRRKGGLLLYINESEIDNHRFDPRWKNETTSLAVWADRLAHDPAVNHQGLYQTIAAYGNYILDQNEKADSCLHRAGLLPASPTLRSQQALTRLLVKLNQIGALDTTTERQLLPSIEWLQRKAIAEHTTKYIGDQAYDDIGQWKQFYRNLMAELLAKIYHKQNDPIREILSIGAGESLTLSKSEIEYQYNATKERLETKYSADQLDSLWRILYPAQNENPSDWLTFLAKSFPVDKTELILARAMTYTREHRWDEALTWLKRVKNKDTLHLSRDPFAQSLIDRQDSLFASDTGNVDCISFVKKMKALTQKEQSGAANANDLYLLATGYYNMTFYGRAWATVKTEREGTYWTALPRGETPFEKDFYGAYTAEKYYRKAMAAAGKDKELQARCLFMAAKCAQKQMRGNFDQAARHNKYFPALVSDYSNTAFYREAFHTCSYLRDFVKQRPR